MSLEELKLDVEEITNFLAQSTRQRVKNVLMVEKHRIETEIVNIEIKAKAAAAEKSPKQSNANAGKEASISTHGEPSSKKYLVELNEYAWDQSDKFVKMFVTLEGVQNLSENDVNVTFTDKSMVLHVQNLNNKDYSLTINNLLHPIDVVKSYRKIKTGMVAIYMKKTEEAKTWSHLTLIEKRLKDKQDADMKNDMKGDDAIVNLMKRMFQSGDAQTKQMIAKAWTESQEKMMKNDHTVDRFGD
ncbi:calcyclin-binding protein [Episyrphus balteatus]|uniref:calcyclin-binding protein n=1 Tax=Episyrphus balteatus TaxID=286459 RepID=UPI00248678A5|nr:calcyclin-binding protein [Episyrphus balteatus]